MEKIFKHNKFTAVFTDENGHFALTGNIDGSSGAVSEKIADVDERFRLLDQMHLSSCETGQPMHCLENGHYHFLEAFEKDNLGKAFIALENYWNIKLSEDEKNNITRIFFDPQVTGLFDYEGQKKLFNDELEKIQLAKNEEWNQKIKAVYLLVDSIPSDLRELEEGFDPEEEFEEPEKALALADFLECDPSIIEENNDNYFSTEGCEYLVLTDDEADESCKEYIEYSLWAFNASFLACETGLPSEIFEALQDQCEGANDAILACIEQNEGLDAFVESAISADGRGHFLSHYDGNEEESNDFFIYQQ